MKKKVFVAMSGGVDSSVAAVLLKNRGFDVVGVYMRNWHANMADPGLTDCPWEDDQENARRAAAKIGIPFYTWDFAGDYKKRVVDYMIEGYRRGETPNPDVMCNKEIKFGLFLDRALHFGADYIATGHYARKFEILNSKSETDPKYKLLAAIDTHKDQSYFLWTLTQRQLKYCLFPIGDYRKPQVRQMARRFGLPNADRKDSQGLCFIGKVDFPRFLAGYLPSRSGAVVTASGRIVGQHRGAHLYTIGQRHGIGVGGGQPYFVVQKDVDRNILTVAPADDDDALWQKELRAGNVNWVAGEPKFPLSCRARIRYRQPLQPCNVQLLGDTLRVVFDESQRAITPGQSIVFYSGSELIGGAVIQ